MLIALIQADNPVAVIISEYNRASVVLAGSKVLGKINFSQRFFGNFSDKLNSLI